VEVTVDVLSPLDAAFLEAEDADPHTSMAIASMAIFDGAPPAHDELVRALSSRLPLIPRYYQRVHRFAFDFAAPAWVNDPDFDINFHVRRTALPAPGGDGELHALMARVMAQRLDRERPLWEMWVIEGVAGGRWALISKVHHCMVDGVAGTELYHLLLSTTPDVDESGVGTGEFEPPQGAGAWGLLANAGWRTITEPVRVATLLSAVPRHPRRAAGRIATTARGLTAAAHVLAPATSTTLLGHIGRQRRYIATVVPLTDVKATAKTYGATVNDVALAAVTGGFRALLLARGEEPAAHAARSLVPANLRVPGTEGQLANRVSCMFVDLPVHIADPVARLRAVHDLLVEAKSAHEAEAGEAIVELSEYQPFALVSAALRAAFHLPQRNIVTVTTNVPGPREPLYLLGRRMLRLLPFVPIADRVRVGVAILSYCDELTFGITGDYDSAADLDVLAAAVGADLAALRPAA
jgi:WS/DGAT/MGAT family acyltransferase